VNPDAAAVDVALAGEKGWQQAQVHVDLAEDRDKMNHDSLGGMHSPA